MSPFTGEHRAFAVRAFYENGKSYITVRRMFRVKFNLSSIRQCPSTQLIKQWLKRFDKTGSTLPMRRQGQPRTVSTVQAIKEVNESVRENPELSTRRRSAALGISRILKFDLKFHPYKIQFRQDRRPRQEPIEAPVPAAPAPAPAPAPALPLPGPKHLSKTASPLTNDPLYLESFMNELGTDMQEAPLTNEVRPTHIGFTDVVEEDYRAVTARSHVYAKNVSPSMHNYYFGMLLHGRMLDIQRQNGYVITNDERDFIEQLESQPYPITKTFELYTSGFGNTAFQASTEHEFNYDKPDLVRAENISGFFGPIEEHAVDYSTYVCPGVLAQRIVEDVAATNAPAANPLPPEWQLEVDLADADVEDAPAPPQPNRRCIGWAPRQRLRQEMMAALNNAGIGEAEFHSENPSIPVNMRLLNYVSAQLSNVPGFVECKIPHGRIGSSAQLVTCVIDEQDRVTGQSPGRMPGSVAFFATAFRNRVQMAAGEAMFAPYDQAPANLGLERNKKNCRYWSAEQPSRKHQKPLHSQKVTVSAAISAKGIIGLYFFENSQGLSVTVNTDRYVTMLQEFLRPTLGGLQEYNSQTWFQQDAATCHTSNPSMDVKKEMFPNKVISKRGNIEWPPRSPDLSPPDFFLWGFLKDKVYSNNPKTIKYPSGNGHHINSNMSARF